MPTFSPKMARNVAGAFLASAASTFSSVFASCSDIIPLKSYSSLQLDLYVDARWQIELHQLVHRLGRGAVQLDQALMNAHFELLARLFVDVRRPQDRVLLDVRRQQNGAGNNGPGALRRLND